MIKIRMTKREAQLFKNRGFLVVDDEYAGNTPDPLVEPVNHRAGDYDYV